MQCTINTYMQKYFEYRRDNRKNGLASVKKKNVYHRKLYIADQPGM